MAPQLMYGRVGVASGLLLGLGFIAGAIGDAFGMQNAVRTQSLVLVFACVAASNQPTEERITELQRARACSTPEPAVAGN